MPSTPLPKSDKTTTLREMIKSYLPPEEKNGDKAHAGVTFIRNLARQILNENQDIADVEFDTSQEQNVGRGVIRFMMNDFSKVMDQAEAEAKAKGREVTEADIVRLIPDGIGQSLAEGVRARIYDAVTSSTTDSM